MSQPCTAPVRRLQLLSHHIMARWHGLLRPSGNQPHQSHYDVQTVVLMNILGYPFALLSVDRVQLTRSSHRTNSSQRINAEARQSLRSKHCKLLATISSLPLASFYPLHPPRHLRVGQATSHRAAYPRRHSGPLRPRRHLSCAPRQPPPTTRRLHRSTQRITRTLARRLHARITLWSARRQWRCQYPSMLLRTQ